MGSDDRAAVHTLGQVAGHDDAAYLAALAHLNRIDRELGC